MARRVTEGVNTLFAWYMVDSLLNLILEGCSKDFIRRVELDVREMVVRVG